MWREIREELMDVIAEGATMNDYAIDEDAGCCTIDYWNEQTGILWSLTVGTDMVSVREAELDENGDVITCSEELYENDTSMSRWYKRISNLAERD